MVLKEFNLQSAVTFKFSNQKGGTLLLKRPFGQHPSNLVIFFVIIFS